MAKTPETKEEFKELLWRIGKCMDKPGTATLNEKTGMLEDHDEELEELFTQLEEVVKTRPEIAVYVWLDKETGAISYPSSKEKSSHSEEQIREFKKRGYVLLCEGKKEAQSFHLVPQENNLIDLALWYPSVKGIKKKEGDLTRDDLILKKGDTTLQFHRNISPPGMFTFRVCGICQDIWKAQGSPDSFFTSRKQIARMMNIIPEGTNMRQIDIALSQLHNMSITAPFWLVNDKAKTKKEVLYKMTILLTHGEVKKDGQWAIELAFNPHLVRNLRKQKYTLLNMDFIKALNSPTAQRLYSKIKRQKGPTWSCSLHKIVDLCNLRGRRKKEIVEKAAKELVENGFLKNYQTAHSKRQKDLVFTFVKKEGGVVESTTTIREKTRKEA